ncbi:MAG TPA: peroxiredoxin [Ktedonobacterales bacterium]|nr:peroxiredoxin [Ktedonobacterales bacterium]
MSAQDVSESQGAQVGLPAPDFTLPNQEGKPITLSDFKGQIVVLYFYPKDNTAGCTAEACAFRDSYQVFKDAGAEVIGVSSDSSESHEQFAAQHHLPFILVSDEGGELRKRYGVPTTMGLWPGRVTYVIDRQGIIRHIFSSQINFEKHVTEALRILQELQSAQA